jgi:hypothetical protein
MGEMKVEHVLLFLVGAFLVYHMMGKCRRVEEYDNPCAPGYCAHLEQYQDHLTCVEC